MGSVEGGAKFEDALPRGFNRRGEVETGGGIKEQDDAIEDALASAPGEGKANGVKHFAAAIGHRGFDSVDDFFESVGIEIGVGIEHAMRELADDVTGAGAGQDILAGSLLEDYGSVVAENEGKEVGERGAFRRVRGEIGFRGTVGR